MLLADINHYLPSPPFSDSGDTAWQLTAATLVGIQSIPGLAILYAGLVKRKWALNSAVMCFYAFSSVLLVWVLWGYNMAFGSPWFPAGSPLNGLIGAPHPILDPASMMGQANIPLASGSLPPLRFASSAMVYFQFVFAAITPVIMVGAVLGRMNFKAWMVFVPLWTTFSYCLCAFMLWGGGILSQWGAVDYSGGYVIHVAAGVAGFVAAAMIGPRLLEDRNDFEPNNLIFALAGAGLLWLGWNGFNGGDPYFASADAALAVLNTNIATATALLCWLILDMITTGKPSAVSMINGMITGLVAITPAAGFVDGYGAIAIAVVGGTLSWWAAARIPKLPFFKKVDDTFSVLSTHGVAGAIGGLMVGIVGNPNVLLYLSNDKTVPPISVNGLIYGGGFTQLIAQFKALVVVVAVNIVMTYLVLKVVSLIIPLRASDGEIEGGDLAIHGTDPMPVPR
ncbi:MAG TPA: ammonium transporter [Candidatus Baltobacteraceae bacterium]|jgi:Amt family ammonium transporter|nr:ammonium transporter [Candidatus Baltobacteraceae bacterium]